MTCTATPCTNCLLYTSIQIAVNYGYINGVGNNRMDPLGEVTREQAAVIIGRLYKDDPGDVSASDLPFSDRNEVSSWAAGYIKAAVDNGIITGYEDGTFRPQNVVTRGEVCLLYTSTAKPLGNENFFKGKFFD